MAGPRARSRTVLALAGCVAVAAGCGGGAKDEGRAIAERSIVGDARPIDAAVLTDAEVRRHDAGSVKRAFAEFWSLLQWEAVPSALDAYDPGLRKFIGDGLLQDALTQGASYFRSSRPEVRSVTGGSREKLVRFVVRGPDHTDLRSQTWKRTAGGWRITYDSLLTQLMAEARLAKVQARVDPAAQTPSTEAVSAAGEARRLQARYAGLRQRRAKGR